MTDVKYTEYYIAFLDILGFRNKVNDPNISCRDILSIYDFLSNICELYFGKENEDRKNNIKTKIMSDSICIYIEASVPNALCELVQFCVAFQHNLLVLDPCIFIRGGITRGNMYVKNDIMFGPALTEAYLLEDNNARVPRIIMCKSTLERGRAESDKTSQDSLDIFVFRDEDAFYVLDYFSVLCLKDNNEAVIDRVNQTVANWLDTTANESIRQKYLYVEKHVRKYLKEKPNA